MLWHERHGLGQWLVPTGRHGYRRRDASSVAVVDTLAAYLPVRLCALQYEGEPYGVLPSRVPAGDPWNPAARGTLPPSNPQSR